MDYERLPQKNLKARRKRGRSNQDGKKAYSERWKNVVYEMETGKTELLEDWVSKDAAIRHRTTNTYLHG
jgi:hypothetical protein